MNFKQACRQGRAGIVRRLLSMGDIGGACYTIGILDACVRGHLSVVKQLIGKHDENLHSWFLRACEEGQLKVAKWLFAQGARPPLHAVHRAACWRGYVQVARWIQRLDPYYSSPPRSLQIVSFFK